MAFDDLPDLSPLRSLKPFERFVFNRHSQKLSVNKDRIVFAMLLDRSLGDFAIQNLIAASISLSLGASKLHVYYRDDRPYKRGIIDLNPYIDRSWLAPGRGGMPMDVFDVAGDAPVKVDDPS